ASKSSFLNDIAVDEARKVAWPAADPSQATGCVKRHDNQLHRARVLEVRIQSPPADSPSLTGSRAPRSRTPAFRADVRAMGGGAFSRDVDRPATWHLLETMSLLGQIPVPQCQ